MIFEKNILLRVEFSLHSGHIGGVARTIAQAPDLPHSPADQVQEHEADKGGERLALSERQGERQGGQRDVRARVEDRVRVQAVHQR